MNQSTADITEHLLKVHRDLKDINFNDLWENAVFVFDANVLLDLYRLPKAASEDLINVLNNKNINGRIWIGLQVLVEFLHNRHSTIGDQKSMFNTVIGHLQTAIEKYNAAISDLNQELSELKLKERHSLINPDKFINEKNIDDGSLYIQNFIKELSSLATQHPDVNDSDELKDIVLDLFKTKTGAGFTNKELQEIYKSGEERYKNNIPPGYKDKTKKDSYEVSDRIFLSKFGDLILWKEIIRKARDENIKHIVLVTGDLKEDWWHEKRGKRLGPRKELLNEIYNDAPNLDTFYMYDTSRFLFHAKNNLKLNIKDSSISDTQVLVEQSRQSTDNREKNDQSNLISLTNIIQSIGSKIEGLTLEYSNAAMKLPPYTGDLTPIFNAFYEIMHNVHCHSSNNHVSILAKLERDFLAIRFVNRAENLDHSKIFDDMSSPLSHRSERGIGLVSIRRSLASAGIDTEVFANNNTFTIKLIIPITHFLHVEE